MSKYRLEVLGELCYPGDTVEELLKHRTTLIRNIVQNFAAIRPSSVETQQAWGKSLEQYYQVSQLY